jgi:hypothetical protein
MANWSNLKSSVSSVIKENGNNEITGKTLQNVLNNIISNLGANEQFGGVATPETRPGTPDGEVFYLAGQAGVYSNFSQIILENGEVAVFIWNGSSWTKKTISNPYVNDLTTGGADKALSAEMGKELQETLTSELNSIKSGESLAAGSITSSKIAAGAVMKSHLADEAVINSKVKDGTLSLDKIDPTFRQFLTSGAIIEDGALTTEQMSQLVVQETGTAEDKAISQKAVTDELEKIKTGESLAAGAIKKSHLGDEAVTNSKVKDGTLSLDKIDSTFRQLLVSGAIIEDGALTTEQMSQLVVQEIGDGENVVMSQKAVSGKLTELGSNLASGRNLVYYYEQGYINSKNKILRGEGERFKFVMIPVHEGEKYAYYSKYYDDLYIAFCADKDTWFERKRVVVGWQDITIPSGCNYLAISIQFYESDSDAVYNAYLYNKKILEELSTEVSKLSTEVPKLSTELSKLEKELFYKEISIAPLISSACTMVAGENPVVEAKDTYRCFRVSVKKGDKVSVYARSGESLPSYGLVKDNVLIFVSAVGLLVEQTFECDGTYDEIIINNYLGYVSDAKVIMYEKVTNTTESDIREVNILMLGNSFTQDSMSYVPFIMQNIAPSIKLNIAIGYIGGCSLAQHCANLLGESQVLNDKTYLPISYTYQLYESGANAWKTIGVKSIDEMLAEKKWNIITLQQNGGNAASSWDKYYAPYIYKIHKALYEKVGNSVKLGWILVHGAYDETSEALLSNWQGSAANTQKIENVTPNQLIFPYGTAVQNLRTTQLNNLGDGGFLMGDNAHLHEGIGCLCAAYANTLTILDALGLGEISIIGEKTRPTKAWCAEHGVLDPNYGEITNDVVGITEDNCYLAQVASIQAVKKPYEVTDCSIF